MSRYGVGLLTMSGVLLVALAMPGAGPAPPAEGQEAFVPAKFIAVDTSRLMGLPDSHEVYGVEAAFPHLTFERPVDFTHAGDGSNRAFVVEQDGRVHVFPNDPGAKQTKVF